MADLVSSNLTSESSRLSSSSDTGTERECSSSSTSASLLSRLKAPNTSEFARKCKVDSNNPPPIPHPRGRGDSVVGVERLVRNLSPQVKSIQINTLLSQTSSFFVECAVKSCHCVINNHIKSAKHEAGKKRLGSKEKTKLDIAEALKASDKLIHPVGETLPQEQRVYRVKVVTAFLRAAIPLNKIDGLRD